MREKLPHPEVATHAPAPTDGTSIEDNPTVDNTKDVLHMTQEEMEQSGDGIENDSAKVNEFLELPF